jgi:hypothetical protein
VLPEHAFIANEAHWITPDVVYLVLVGSGVVAGARVGGQLVTTPFGDYSSDPTTYAKASLLERYMSADPLDPGFLEADRKNFRFSSAELLEARFSARRTLWTGGVPNSGTVTLVPRAGRRRRLILLGHQDLGAVQNELAAAGVPLSPLAD